MTPDLCYTTTGREGESRSSLIHGTGKKFDEKSKTAFPTSYTKNQYIRARYSDS